MQATENQRAMSNLEYDLLTALKHKAEALKAYETYIQDAQEMQSQPCAELFKKLQQQDMQQAEQIRHHLQEVMQKGKMQKLRRSPPIAKINDGIAI